MAYGFCYDPPTKCRGKCQPGVTNYRVVVDELIPEVGDKGCYNCRNSRTGSTLSLHGEGRADDVATEKMVNGRLVPDLELNHELAEFNIAAAEALGIQRVIAWGLRADGTFGPREWDSRQGERLWERYSGPLHKDHNHVEFCWAAATGLTKSQVRAAVARYWRPKPLIVEDAMFIRHKENGTVFQIQAQPGKTAVRVRVPTKQDGQPAGDQQVDFLVKSKVVKTLSDTHRVWRLFPELKT